MMQFNSYTLTLRHDKGTVNITTVAGRMTQAVRLILNAELAPFSAITAIKCNGSILDANL